jgi:hypothetical protein
MAAFVLIVLLVAVVWSLCLRKSVEEDRAAAEEAAREAEEREKREEDEARLRRKGEPLRCLGCGAIFKGPLPDDGCPQCHVASLVVSERAHGKMGTDASEKQTLRKDG